MPTDIIPTDEAEAPDLRRMPSDLCQILMQSVPVFMTCAEWFWWHYERAVARGLAKGLVNGRSAILLRGAARRAERLADSLGCLSGSHGELTPKDWRRWLRRDLYKFGWARRRAISAATCEFWNAGSDRDSPEFYQLHELDYGVEILNTLSVIYFIEDAICFTLAGVPPLGWRDVAAWRLQVIEKVANLRTLLASRQ